MNPPSALPFALVLGLAGLLPALLLLGTSWVKCTVALGALRSALGAPQVPGSVVVLGLSAVLTLQVMAPTASRVVEEAGDAVTAALAADPLTPAGRAAWTAAWSRAKPPVARFLRDNTHPRDRAFALELARGAHARQRATATPPTADDAAVLLTGFALSELARAFALAFLLLLPFLVVDVVTANVLAAAGLHTLPVAAVALPAKLLLFVAADGWHHLARALVLGYR